MTNGDAIRKMNDEELAPFLCSITCPPGDDLVCRDKNDWAEIEDCIECWRRWLKEEVRYE